MFMVLLENKITNGDNFGTKTYFVFFLRIVQKNNTNYH